MINRDIEGPFPRHTDLEIQQRALSPNILVCWGIVHKVHFVDRFGDLLRML